jgi:hypothetical protein
LPAGHDDAGCGTAVKKASFKGVAYCAVPPNAHPSLSNSLHIWLGAKALSQFLLMGNQRGILL